MKFSDKVKYVRMKLELSQEALATELGVSYSTLCKKQVEMPKLIVKKANIERSFGQQPFRNTRKPSLNTVLQEELIWQI